MLEAQTRALVALPQTMAFSQVYQALQTGVVDGTGTAVVHRQSRQCASSTGIVIELSTVRVAPPRTSSRARLCP